MKTLKIIVGFICVGIGIASIATGVGPVLGITLGGMIILRAVLQSDD